MCPSNKDENLQQEEAIYKNILANIKEYKKAIKAHQDFLETQLGLNLKGLLQGNSKAFFVDAMKDLVKNTKENLENIERAIANPENLRTMGGVKQIERLIQRSIEDVDEKYKRVIYNNEKPEEVVANKLFDFCKDIKTQFVRFAEDLICNVFNYFKYSSEQNKKLGAALDKEHGLIFKDSLAKDFKETQTGLRDQIRNMRDLEQQIEQAEVNLVNVQLQ